MLNSLRQQGPDVANCLLWVVGRSRPRARTCLFQAFLEAASPAPDPLTSYLLPSNLMNPFKSQLCLWTDECILPLWPVMMACSPPPSPVAAPQPLGWKKFYGQPWFCQFTNWVFHNSITKGLLIPECLGMLNSSHYVTSRFLRTQMCQVLCLLLTH